jgi:hypothetical protein
VILDLFLAAILAADPYSALAPGKPTIPAPLSSVSRGTKEEALLRTLKVNADQDTCFTLGVRVDSLCFVPFWTKDDGYDRPALLFSSLAATRTALRKRWGEPIIYEGSWYWLNPEKKLRARLRDTDDPAQLDFETYLPLQEFLGAGAKLAFEHTPILGSTRAAIEQAYGVKCESSSCGVFFPPIEVGSQLLVQIELTGEVATRYLFDLPARNEARKELTFKLLEAKWGRCTLVEGEKKDWNFEKRSDVLLYLLAGDLTVRIPR